MDFWKWLSILLAAVLISMALKGSVYSWVRSLRTRSGGRSQPHSVLFELLEGSTRQLAAIVEIRDTLRRPVGEPSSAAAIREFRDIMNARLASSFDGEKAVALLGQIRDYSEETRKAWSSYYNDERNNTVPSDISSIATAVKQFDGVGGKLDKILAQLEKNDQRLADFVNANRRIMRAIEGNAETDEDTELFEEAKLIQSRAASKGVDLTPEDALKRAREQRNWRMG